MRRGQKWYRKQIKEFICTMYVYELRGGYWRIGRMQGRGDKEGDTGKTIIS